MKRAQHPLDFTRFLKDSRPPSEKLKAKSKKHQDEADERSLHTTVMMSNTAADSSGKQQHQCDCCLNTIISDDSDHVQNFPCGHKICFLCFVTSTMKRGANPACCQVKDCPQKYTASCQYFNRGNPGKVIENEVAVIDNASVGDLSTDVLANVFGFLGLKDIMQKRRVCEKWKEAAKMTIVPISDFCVNSVNRYNAMTVMTRVMPILQQITLRHPGYLHKWSDGEDPNERWAAEYANHTAHDIEIISNFSKLKDLKIFSASLNGRYPFLFNSFPLLQKLTIKRCNLLKWDLGMLAGFPVLKELVCVDNYRLTGNINSLKVLKDTLEKVAISNCESVEGKLMDLADFLHLKGLSLDGTAVTGDIRDIGENDFLLLEYLGNLPESVFGARGYNFQRISDATDLVRTLYLLKTQRPALKMGYWYGKLSEDSPDWYQFLNIKYPPPFFIHFVEAGSRIGYQWKAFQYQWRGDILPCEVNWLDPEPSRESSVYGKYTEELQKIEKERQEKRRVDLYKGIHQPPSEDEYHRLLEEYDLLPNTT